MAAEQKESHRHDAVIVDAVRTPIGKGKPGGLANAAILERL